MKVCVFGLWHLGTVTAACIAAADNTVVGLDFDRTVIEGLRNGKAPLFEPGLDELITQGLAKGNLTFTSETAEALKDAQLIWIAYDTPVDENDVADVDFVFNQITKSFEYLAPESLVLVSSQLPVGTTGRLEKAFAEARPGTPVRFAYSPENLRLGKAIAAFTEPNRVVVGLRLGNSELVARDQKRIVELLRPFTDRVEWMSVESAEMTKHALNAFLATSVAFINEVASICEQVGADAQEVARGLKTELRIGPRAYLNPGAAFAGGTLARDVMFLEKIGAEQNQLTHLLSGVRASNSRHREWVRRKLATVLGDLKEQKVAVWGLTYKPGTNTLRRSDSVELCTWLSSQGAVVSAHDPAIDVLPEALAKEFALASTPIDALQGAAAVVMATGWPLYKTLNADAISSAMASPIVIDPNRFLEETLGGDARVQYFTVGKAFT
jgi:UDPglucose 6-dehydrogenase